MTIDSNTKFDYAVVELEVFYYVQEDNRMCDPQHDLGNYEEL